MKKIVLSVATLVIVAGLFLLFQNRGADYDGEITIIVHDGREVVSEETFLFSEGDTLLNIMNEYFDLVCANASYKPSDECHDLLLGSPVILEIDNIKTNWTDNYFAIYVNDIYSNLGIDMISLVDGDIIRFEVQEVGDE
jgi:hypothetical protein